jgi:D-glycero-alpha-D-manno-heptose-7-phosphate kinase
MGGTLDIPTFSLPLRRLSPATVNIAINLRTTVRLLPCRKGTVRISSTGFAPAEFSPEDAPYDHPLGLIFAVAAYFHLAGVEIRIDSASPIRSALGGSSVAVVALVGLLGRIAESCGERGLTAGEVAALAHGLESAVARVPCGFQDQLAAVFGGVNAWLWTGDLAAGGFRRQSLMQPPDFPKLERRMLAAYLGRPHESKDINGQWVARFLAGRDRKQWFDIVDIVHDFADSLIRQDFEKAARLMNRETEIRMAMTPDVLDAFGRGLVEAAAASGCGARFTGAGGGGCVWAIGEQAAVADLRRRWSGILKAREDALLLDVGVDSDGLLCQLYPDIDADPRTD